MLNVGQKIKTGGNVWVVLELLNQKNHTPRVRIRVEKIGPHMATYLNQGQEYVLRQSNKLYYPEYSEEYHVWAVPDKKCKRTTSQVLLYDWPANEGGPKVDIDC